MMAGMEPYRIALANLRFPGSAEESLELALRGVVSAGDAGAKLVCFPECYVPGYRRPGTVSPPGDAAFLERAWQQIGHAARAAHVAVLLGTERVVEGGVMATVLVIDAHGERLGFQDKVQIDPSEEGIYVPGTSRRVFETAGLKFGISICHEGFRYPETVRWAAQRGARVVFHPQVHEAEPGAYQPTRFADTAGTFHEKSALCRAAENTVYFATVNVASPGSPTTSAIVRPDGTLLAYQPYGVEGLLVAELDLGLATGLLASRYKRAD
jgi:predicted amidohydrolase